MKPLASSLLASRLLLALVLALTVSHASQAIGAPVTSDTAQPIAADNLVTLERRFDAVRGGPCTDDLGFPTNRVLADGTRELFTVPAGMSFVVTDLEGDITPKASAGWPLGAIGVLTATLTGSVANQYVRARGQLDSDAAASGIVTVKLHLQSGVAADSGATVCLRAHLAVQNGFHSAQVGTDVRVHGYLVAR
jgi:hypothetical protein